MKEFCQNERCENPGFREVRVSVRQPGDQARTLCASCEEAYYIGVQHGTITAYHEPATRHIKEFLDGGGFVVLGHNRSDPSDQGAVEAWAYRGPLDFDAATPVVFGVGPRIRDALIALDMAMADPHRGRQGPKRDGLGKVTAIEVDDRELATILAALRAYQAFHLLTPDEASRDIATDGGLLEPLTASEIDPLCERLNLGASPVAKAQAAQPTIQKIHDLLYLDIENGREFYNPDKSWDAETMSGIAEVVAEHVPRPKQLG